MANLSRYVARVLLSLVMLLPLMASGFSASAAENQHLVSGVIAITTKPVTITSRDGQGRITQRLGRTGDAIYLDDEITTPADGTVQILLKDQTVFSMGSSSSIVFDRFIYDPSGGRESSLIATVKKGAFKFISGKIAKSDPDAMVLNLPNASAAIRGTTVAGFVGADGASELLLLSGRISVTTNIETSPVDVFTSGWGVNIAASGAPSEAVSFATTRIDSIVASAEINQESPVERVGERGSEQVGERGVQTASTRPVDASAHASTIAAPRLLSSASPLDVSTNLRSDLSSDLQAVIALDQDNRVTVAPSLADYARLGKDPLWVSLSQNGRSFENLNKAGDYASTVADHYQGSVHFSNRGMELLSNTNLGSGSGMADYSAIFDYSAQTISGVYSVYDVILGGRAYNDARGIDFDVDIAAGVGNGLYKASVFAPSLAAGDVLSSGGHTDENQNGLLDYGEKISDVHVDKTVLTGDDSNHGAVARMAVSIGSISDGDTAIDGSVAGVVITVDEVDISDSDNPQYSGHGVGGDQYLEAVEGEDFKAVDSPE